MCAASAGLYRSSHQRRPISPYKDGGSGTLGNTTDVTGDTARPVGSWSIGAMRPRLPEEPDCDDSASLSGSSTCPLWLELESELLHNAGRPLLEEEEALPSWRRWNILICRNHGVHRNLRANKLQNTSPEKKKGVAPSMLKILWSEFLSARHLLSGAPKERLGSV